MSSPVATVQIENRDYWFKVVGMLQQNWALIDVRESGVVVWFIGDTAGVFDEIELSSFADAEDALRRNGFRRYAEDREAHELIAPPGPPFHRLPHPNGAIYSSSRFWK